MKQVFTLWIVWIFLFFASDAVGSWYDPYSSLYNAAISLGLALFALPILTYWSRAFILLCLLRGFFELVDSLVYFPDQTYDIAVLALNCLEILVIFGLGGVTMLRELHAEYHRDRADRAGHIVSGR